MGMTFRHLLSKTENSIKHSYEEFTLYAFIVHDKDTDIDFHHHVNVMFDKFDFITNKKLLFIALAEPEANELGVQTVRRSFTAQSRRTIVDKFGLPEFRNETEFVKELFEWIKVQPEDMPVIVVIGEFFHESITIRTNKRYLERQLSQLGYLADRIKPGSWNIDEIIKRSFYENRIPGIEQFNTQQYEYDVELIPEERRIVYNRHHYPSVEIQLAPKEFAWYIYFIKRIFLGQEPIRFNPDSRDYDNDVRSFILETNTVYQMLFDRPPAQMDEFNFIRNFNTTKTRINDNIRRAVTTPDESNYLTINDTGPRGATRYYLALERDKVETRSEILLEYLNNG